MKFNMFCYVMKTQKCDMFGRILLFSIEGNSNIDQKLKEIAPKMIDLIILKIILGKYLERGIMISFFCSFCSQVVINKPMTWHVLS